MNEIITRSQALARGLKTYFTGRPCSRGGVAERNTRDASCQCDACKAHRATVAAAYYAENRVDIAEYRAKVRQVVAAEEKAAKQHEIATLVSERDTLAAELQRLQAERDDLAARLAQIERQEPVGRLMSDPYDGHVFVPHDPDDWSMLGQELYLAAACPERQPLTREQRELVIQRALDIADNEVDLPWEDVIITEVERAHGISE